MAGRQCYHCKQWIEEGEAHDCWTTTEAALTRGSLRRSAGGLGAAARDRGRVRRSAHLRVAHSIMFSRKSCYFFVRPKKSFLEVVVFLGRALKAPQVQRADEASKSKVANFIRITHRDEVEAPITDWLRKRTSGKRKKGRTQQ